MALPDNFIKDLIGIAVRMTVLHYIFYQMGYPELPGDYYFTKKRYFSLETLENEWGKQYEVTPKND